MTDIFEVRENPDAMPYTFATREKAVKFAIRLGRLHSWPYLVYHVTDSGEKYLGVAS